MSVYSLAFLWLCAFSTSPAQPQKPENRLEKIVAEVQRWERQYENIEVLIRERYTHHGVRRLAQYYRKHRDEWKSRPIMLSATAQQTRTIKIIAQVPCFRMEIEGERRDGMGNTEPICRIRAFDGKKTRLMALPDYGEIVDGRREEIMPRPHKLLFMHWPSQPAPLSDFLRADFSHPSLRNWSDLVLRVRYLRKEEMNRLTTDVIEMTSYNKYDGTLNSRTVMWLVENHNYIPVKIATYTGRWSLRLPSSEAVVDEWQELRPGLWYPKKFHTIKYDVFALKRERKQKVYWRADLTVEKASLNPKYPPEIFRDVPFFDGMHVVEVVNGKIVRSYVVGSKQKEQGK